MNFIKQKNFLLLGIIFGSLIFFANYFFSIYNAWQSEILQTQLETKKILAEEKILSNFQNSRENLNDFIELNEENIFNIREQIPETSEQEKFTDAIYRVAEKNNISINSLQVEEPLEVEVDKDISANFFRQALRVQLEADYISLLNFLREIEDGERFSVLTKLSVENAEGILICEVEFFIFSAKFL